MLLMSFNTFWPCSQYFNKTNQTYKEISEFFDTISAWHLVAILDFLERYCATLTPSPFRWDLASTIETAAMHSNC